MSPRINLPEPPPSLGLQHLLDLEERQENTLRATRVILAQELRKLSTARGLTVRLAAEDVRAELRLRLKQEENVDAD